MSGKSSAPWQMLSGSTRWWVLMQLRRRWGGCCRAAVSGTGLNWAWLSSAPGPVNDTGRAGPDAASGVLQCMMRPGAADAGRRIRPGPARTAATPPLRHAPAPRGQFRPRPSRLPCQARPSPADPWARHCNCGRPPYAAVMSHARKRPCTHAAAGRGPRPMTAARGMRPMPALLLQPAVPRTAAVIRSPDPVSPGPAACHPARGTRGRCARQAPGRLRHQPDAQPATPSRNIC